MTGEADSNEYLTFGTTHMGKGEAFAIGAETNRIPVTKHWVLLDGRQCLVEQIPFLAAQPQLQELPLPPAGTARLQAPSDSLLGRVTTRRMLPGRRLAKQNGSGFTLASTTAPMEGFAMDYTSVTVQTNRAFQSDVTYYVSASVTLMGTNIFEGGTVIKFATNTTLTIAPSLTPLSVTFSGNDYRPIVFTAKDDNSAGETIPGSTGTPAGYYGNPALVFGGLSQAPPLGHARFAYAQQAVLFSGLSGNIFDAQFVNCQSGVQVAGGTLSLRNVLFANTVTNLAIQSSSTVTAENVTFSGSACLATGPSGAGSSLALTNCILANVTNLVAGTLATSGDYNGFYQATPFGYDIAPTSSGSPFRTVGAGNFYLAPDSPYRNAGTFTINSDLLGNLGKKTTYPPLVYAQTYLPSTLTSLSPQAQRDTDTPDLGWHYEALDYALGYTAVTNPTILTINPGTAVAMFATNGGTYGLGVFNGGGLVCQGSPTALSRLVVYNTVQEQPVSGWAEPLYGMVTDNLGSTPASQINFRFADFSSLAQRIDHLNMAVVVANLQDCQLHGGYLSASPPTLNLTNCLLERVSCSLWQMDNAQPVIRNNTFYGGTLDFLPLTATNAIVQDNLFDQASIPEDLTSSGYLGGHNASVTNYAHMQPSFPSDIVLLSSPAYQAGPLGNCYQLSSSQLFNANSNTTPAQVGLYHYTTITNLVSGYQIKETNSWLDCGFHYVAVDSNTNAIDSNGDGIPDYLSDANGNGQVDSGEIGWNIVGDLGLKVLITRPQNNSILP